jgi:hypothetical protein
MRFAPVLGVSGSLLIVACATTPDDPARLVRVDHSVHVQSTAPAMA